MPKVVELEAGEVLRDYDGRVILVATGPVAIVRPIVSWEAEPRLVAEARRLASPDMEEGAGI